MADSPPTAYKADKMKPFLDAYERLGTIARAAKHVGINRDTVYEWRERFADFREAFKKADERLADHFEDNIMQLADKGDLGANIFLLKGKTRKYDERLRHSIEAGQMAELATAFIAIIKRVVPETIWPRLEAELNGAILNLQGTVGTGTSSSSDASVTMQ